MVEGRQGMAGAVPAPGGAGPAPAAGPGRPPRVIRVHFRDEWAAPGAGLFAPDPRVRTLRRVLVSYPDVRHILPDRISLDPGVEDKVVDTVIQFLQRQQWLVRAVERA